jgi:hypothetical protein
MTLPWFRLYHEFSGDPVVQGLDFGDQRHYVMILCLKASGFLDRSFPSPEFRNRSICKALGLDPITGAEARRRLTEVGLVDDDWHPPSWERRQFKSDCSSARVAKFRAKASGEESKKDLNIDTEGTVTRNVSETLHTKKNTRRTSSRIPDDFGLTPEREAYAAKNLPKVNATALMEGFVDHWRAKTGKDAVKADWDATWRNWVRNANTFGYPMVTVSTPGARPIRIDANGRRIDG